MIEKQALQLSDTERALLADRLLLSLTRTSDELTEAWVREADERIEAFREGKIAAVDGPKAIRSLKVRFVR